MIDTPREPHTGEPPVADQTAATAGPPDVAGEVPPRTGRTPLVGPGQLLYLPASGRIVVLHERAVPRWWCLLLADPSGAAAPGSMVQVTDGQVLTALRVPLGDPAKPLPAHTFAGVWLTQVTASVGDAVRNLVAAALAKQVRSAHRRVVVVNNETRHMLADAARITDLDIIDRTVMDLIMDGFLEVVPPLTPTGQAVFRLILRYQPWTVPGTADGASR